MSARRRKKAREQDVTERYLAGDMDEDAVEHEQRFSDRNKNAQQDKMIKTAAKRAAVEATASASGETDLESLPIGQVLQVYSLFCEVMYEGNVWLCTTRKTLNKLSKTQIVVGDHVRFRESESKVDPNRPGAVIEQVLPRRTILTRADSFKGTGQHPIVANADQMLIVASLTNPEVKWGLVDRMLIAAQSGNLKPIICLNKIDLASDIDAETVAEANAALEHYQSLGAHVLRTSADSKTGLDELRAVLKDRATVLAGHSGVGKSSLINSIQPHLDLRVGEVSGYTAKGRHTTTSARRYSLDFGGAVIDTPGVKLFGLWGVTRENLESYFPDVGAGTAPQWRIDSLKRIERSISA
ncbi:MAG: ribosome biosis GTPase / thiamine phosphate phosphatase [Humisphaera sp.]|nr:ribosome biosis GTPase / thiamine phosphate phosphatase [Humisphaera sp.]